MHWETKNVRDSLYCNTCFTVMVWNQTHNISWDACTLPSHYCSYTGQCDWLLISATGQKGYMSLSGWPLKSPTWFSMGISWECLCIQFSSVAQLCPTLCDPMNRSTPGLPVHHQLPEFTQTLVHRVGDAIQPSHPLSSPSPPAPQSLPASEFFPMSQLFTSS